MRRTFAFALILSSIVACGSDDTTTPIDAPSGGPDAADGDAMARDASEGFDGPGPDAAASSVVEVPCAGATIASEVTAPGPGFNFVITQATIASGAVVRFMMPGVHSAVSGNTPGVADGLFSVGFSETKCFQFTAAGTFGFWCNPHQFTGSITVTP
ncbi:MAG: hypothetical protein IPL61_25355 [Myxococcales bacterium]|nr:hypothetical protein [Myxococcales bacterium]